MSSVVPRLFLFTSSPHARRAFTFVFGSSRDRDAHRFGLVLQSHAKDTVGVIGCARIPRFAVDRDAPGRLRQKYADDSVRIRLTDGVETDGLFRHLLMSDPAR